MVVAEVVAAAVTVAAGAVAVAEAVWEAVWGAVVMAAAAGVAYPDVVVLVAEVVVVVVVVRAVVVHVRVAVMHLRAAVAHLMGSWLRKREHITTIAQLRALKGQAVGMVSEVQLAGFAARLAEIWNCDDLHLAGTAAQLVTEPSLRCVLMESTDEKGNTPLHIVASRGHLEACRYLLQAGAIARRQNLDQRRPVDLAKENGHAEVVQLLSTGIIGGALLMRGGNGKAFRAAMQDQRNVHSVTWFSVRLHGFAGFLGGRHSLLRVTVAKSGCSEPHEYLLEKARPNEDHEDTRHGVYLTHWNEVSPFLEVMELRRLQPQHLGSAVRADWRMQELRELAVDMGPYEVGSCNCHHAALKVFNACAKPEHRVPEAELPNRVLARALATLVALPGRHWFASESGSVLPQAALPAILDSDKRIAYRGTVLASPAVRCVASFPGKYGDGWNAVVQEFHGMSVACVFLNEASAGLGQHAEDPERPHSCYCASIYGKRDPASLGYLKRVKRQELGQHAKEADAMNAVLIADDAGASDKQEAEQEAERRCLASGHKAAWGCRWFHDWKLNIDQARRRGQRLVVYYFKGQVGQGKLRWEHLADLEHDLWDGIGLGGSQKCEAAYLDRMGYDYDEEDVGDFLRKFGG